MEKLVLCWSGGKDSAYSLFTILQEGRCEVSSLLTTVTESYDRISMHGVRRSLLEAQAAALGLPLTKVWIPKECPNEIYEARMREALLGFHRQGIRRVAFGDIFLEDLRKYREENLARLGMEAVFPLWKKDTQELARRFIADGFRAVITCVDPRAVDGSLAGRAFDGDFLAALPPGADPCGENGEFHSFVHDGPVFARPVAHRVGEVVERDSFVYCDLLPVESPGSAGPGPARRGKSAGAGTALRAAAAGRPQEVNPSPASGR